tara:strand:- start:140 stop:346 length:207 start_codon:yes stop_codon:yes gene_type:complete
MLHLSKKGMVLIPTNNEIIPFIIRTFDDNGNCFFLPVFENGVLTGDAIRREDFDKHKFLDKLTIKQKK